MATRRERPADSGDWTVEPLGKKAGLGFGVYRGGELVTRVEDEAAGDDYVARARGDVERS